MKRHGSWYNAVLSHSSTDTLTITNPISSETPNRITKQPNEIKEHGVICVLAVYFKMGFAVVLFGSCWQINASRTCYFRYLRRETVSFSLLEVVISSVVRYISARYIKGGCSLFKQN